MCGSTPVDRGLQLSIGQQLSGLDDPGGDSRIGVPEACSGSYEAICEASDLGAIDDACLEAACGAVVSSFEAGCCSDGELGSSCLDCAAPLTS